MRPARLSWVACISQRLMDPAGSSRHRDISNITEHLCVHSVAIQSALRLKTATMNGSRNSAGHRAQAMCRTSRWHKFDWAIVMCGPATCLRGTVPREVSVRWMPGVCLRAAWSCCGFPAMKKCSFRHDFWARFSWTSVHLFPPWSDPHWHNATGSKSAFQ